MKKLLAALFISLAFASSAFGLVNPNTIQGYPNIFTGKNTVVNGGIEISQIFSAASHVAAATGDPTTGAGYPVDNVMLTTSTVSVFSTVQVNSTNVATYTAGYLGSLGATNALQTSVNATHGAPAATDEFALYFPIEGLNFSRLQYGTANAKAGSLQFKERCSVSGTYSGAIKNYANTRAYLFSFSCTAGTDTQVYVQNIPGDTGGTWVGNTNQGAAYVTFDLGSGANFLSTASTWQTGNYNGVTGELALSAQANGAILTITDVQFEVGAFSTQFERKLNGLVLAECQRYLPYLNLPTAYATLGVGYSSTTTVASIVVYYPVQSRVAPTGVIYNTNFAIFSAAGTSPVTTMASPQYGVLSASLAFTTINVAMVQGQAVIMGNNNTSNSFYFTGSQI